MLGAVTAKRPQPLIVCESAVKEVMVTFWVDVIDNRWKGKLEGVSEGKTGDEERVMDRDNGCDVVISIAEDFGAVGGSVSKWFELTSFRCIRLLSIRNEKLYKRGRLKYAKQKDNCLNNYVV